MKIIFFHIRDKSNDIFIKRNRLIFFFEKLLSFFTSSFRHCILIIISLIIIVDINHQKKIQYRQIPEI